MTLLRTREFITSPEYNRHVFLWVAPPESVDFLSAARFKLNIGRLLSLTDDEPILLGDLRQEYNARLTEFDRVDAEYRAAWEGKQDDPDFPAARAEHDASIKEWNAYDAQISLEMKKRLAGFLYEEVRAPDITVTPADPDTFLRLEKPDWWCPEEGKTRTLVLDVLTFLPWLMAVSGLSGDKKKELTTRLTATSTPSLKAVQ